MKLAPRQVEAFLKSPDAEVCAALIYGPDTGLVRERARRLALTVVDNLDDPFRVSELTGDLIDQDPARLGDEIGSLSLVGGRRLIRVRNARNRHAKVIGGEIQNATSASFVIVESDQLTPRDSLRTAFEKSPNAVAIACYEDSTQTLEQLIQSTLYRAGHAITPDALAYLTENLGNDRQVSRGELQKLTLYKSEDPGDVTLAEVRELFGDNSTFMAEDVAQNCADGDIDAFDRNLSRCLFAGNNPIQLVRAVTGYFVRLHRIVAQREDGKSIDSAIAQCRPPIHFSRRDAIARQARMWSTGRLAQALNLLLQTEIDCKTTGAPAEIICQHALLRIAGGARRKRAER